MLWSYELPPDRIAQHPLTERDQARLLIYAQGNITESTFLHLAQYLPEGALLIYNDSKVVPARLRQGNREFLLTRIEEGGWNQGSPQRWRGLFRPGKFWRKGEALVWEEAGVHLKVHWVGEANEREGLFEVSWSPPQLSALQVLERLGEVPLPPYVEREASSEDRERYQTFFARLPGSVAAPTAGLHFTQAVLESLQRKGIMLYPVTLHVGIGTFLPIQRMEVPEEHEVGEEWFYVPLHTLMALRKASGPIVCVGTTSLRVIESLYWLGVLRLQGQNVIQVPKFPWKDLASDMPASQALAALPAPVRGTTALYVLPGYPFKLVRGLITNFHLPGSTLLALVQAFIGLEGIQKVYRYALEQGFRFLSYGDTSLLWRE
ncbi:MAG: S-adenosylmethionine:tRNA ribosyltransferase-isomerase [Bacteroidia bacterium]|nr:S-adenosylmethionine:tRNA ribosyltransferase-isomerase [Bacteroidia bacterium]MDW8235057.1 S-adenosylmethionine:tRNA ribosyltransferase-isomerase [Bacteroidia bacterium]